MIYFLTQGLTLKLKLELLSHTDLEFMVILLPSYLSISSAAIASVNLHTVLKVLASTFSFKIYLKNLLPFYKIVIKRKFKSKEIYIWCYMSISLSFLKKEITLCLSLSLLFCSAVNRITGTGHAKEILLILNNIYIHPSNAYHFGFQQHP